LLFKQPKAGKSSLPDGVANEAFKWMPYATYLLSACIKLAGMTVSVSSICHAARKQMLELTMFGEQLGNAR
jgi:hypothetical protein